MSQRRIGGSENGSGTGTGLSRVVMVLLFSAAADRLLPRLAQQKRQPDPNPTRPFQGEAWDDASTDAATGESEDRGRSASDPSEIPVRGWKDILLRVFRNISGHRIMALAAGVTLLQPTGDLPGAGCARRHLRLFYDASTITRHLNQLNGLVPGGALEIARDQLTRVASKGAETLGVTFVVGLSLSLWSANAAVKSLFDTLNIVYGEEEKRSFIKLNTISLGFILGGIVLTVAALISVVVIPVVMETVGLSDVGDLLLRIGRWPAMLLVLSVI